MAPHNAVISIVQFNEAGAVCLISDQTGDAQAAAMTTLHFTMPNGLGDVFSAHHSADGACYLLLPRHEATLRIITLPTQDPREIEAMVRLSAAEFVPYPIEEMVVTHQSLAQLPGGESHVLVVLVQQDVLNGHLKRLADAGREPVQIFLSTACLAAIATRCDAPGDVALLHVDSAALELAVFREGILRFSRAIVQAAPWNLEDAHSREALVYEVRELLAAYRRESDDGLGADTIYLSTLAVPAPALCDILRAETQKDISIAPTETTLSDENTPCPATLAGALHLIDGDGPLQLHLAPAGLAKSRAIRALQSQLLFGAGLCAIVVCALLLWFGQALWQRSNLIAELQEQRDHIAPNAQGIAAKQQSLHIISRQVDRGGSFLELLSGVSAAAPPADFNITRVQFDRETGMNIWGRAASKDLILKEFLGQLRQGAEGSLSHFSNAHSLYETEGTERGVPIFNYQIAIPQPEEDAHVVTSGIR